jgi:hypothetical protein
MKALIAVCFALLAAGAMQSVCAQFSPAFLQNASYWDDGKAEVDLYDAQVMRDGQLRPCEITVILRLEKFTPPPNSADQTPPRELPAIAMTKMFTAPTGLTARQEAALVFLGRDGRLLNAGVVQVGADGISETQANPVSQNSSFSFSHRDERGVTSLAQLADATGAHNDPFAAAHPSASASPTPPPERKLFLYEELPLLVRTIQFTKPTGEFSIKIVSTLSHWTGVPESADANVSYKAGERAIEVLVKKGSETDRFLLDPGFPFLLREWQMADGSHLKLKNSLRVDYRQYLKNGDREKALKDPMLRHPD